MMLAVFGLFLAACIAARASSFTFQGVLQSEGPVTVNYVFDGVLPPIPTVVNLPSFSVPNSFNQSTQGAFGQVAQGGTGEYVFSFGIVQGLSGVALFYALSGLTGNILPAFTYGGNSYTSGLYDIASGQGPILQAGLTQGSVSVTPEPPTGLLLLSGTLAGWLAWAWRRRAIPNLQS